MTDARPLVVAAMPPLAPLQLTAQDLDRAPVPRWHHAERRMGLRVGVLIGAALIAGALLWLFLSYFAPRGPSALEVLMGGIIAFSAFWLALSALIALAGAVRRAESLPDLAQDMPPLLDVALVMPIYAEDAAQCFSRAVAMLEAANAGRRHSYTLYLLSDTQDEALAATEAALFQRLRAAAPALPVFYRRRVANTDRKIGNLSDWLSHWGGAHEAAIVLDADSLMTAQAILALSDELALTPSAGLIQSTPQIIGAKTLLARAQAFASAAYGTVYARGLDWLWDAEASYWGHNAILRISAFAEAAQLPRLRGRLILSHDVVEAGLLRRAGWGVTLLTLQQGSYEEAPPTLPTYLAREARWCAGNLQHLRLITVPGLHPMTRWQLFQGAASYLMAPLWLFLVLMWALLGSGSNPSVLAILPFLASLRPTWPEMPGTEHLEVMIAIYSLILLPKFVGLWGAWRHSILALAPLQVLAEFVLTALLAPISMVHTSRQIFATLTGCSIDWHPADRSGKLPRWVDLLRLHWIETLLGSALIAAIALGYVSAWLTPIALSLMGAVLLSRLTALPIAGHLWTTPQDIVPPAELGAAHIWQKHLISERLNTDTAA